MYALDTCRLYCLPRLCCYSSYRRWLKSTRGNEGRISTSDVQLYSISTNSHVVNICCNSVSAIRAWLVYIICIIDNNTCISTYI